MQISDWSSDVCSSDLNGACRTRHGPAAMRRQAKPAPPALARHSRNVVRIWPYQCRGKRGVRKQATVMSVAAEYLPAVHAASGLDLNQAPPAPDGKIGRAHV